MHWNWEEDWLLGYPIQYPHSFIVAIQFSTHECVLQSLGNPWGFAYWFTITACSKTPTCMHTKPPSEGAVRSATPFLFGPTCHQTLRVTVNKNLQKACNSLYVVNGHVTNYSATYSELLFADFHFQPKRKGIIYWQCFLFITVRNVFPLSSFGAWVMGEPPSAPIHVYK